MTRVSIVEYVEAVRGRYYLVSKKEKGKILDEFTKVTGFHRKAAIRLFWRGGRNETNRKHGRPRRYSTAVVGALRVIWEATDRLCSKRLHPFLPEVATILRRHGESDLTAEIEVQLCQMSPATIDRLLRPYRRLGGRHPFSTTKRGSLLKSSIPIRTFADWQEDSPGFLEVDLVSHCGESVDGFYLTTLCSVDVTSGWSECVGVWGKGQQRVGAAIHQVRQRLPLPLLGLDSDNGSEFINQHLYPSIGRIASVRGLASLALAPIRRILHRKDCHVEQKNWSVVRRLILRRRMIGTALKLP